MVFETPVAGAEISTRLAPAARCGRLGFVRLEEAGAFEHQLDAEVLVRQLARIALLGDRDVAAVDLDRVAVRGHRAGEAAVGRIEREQQRVRLGIGEVVDRDQLEVVIGALEDRPRDEPPDAPEPVDRNLHRHAELLLA
jgi:hypothetical protein